MFVCCIGLVLFNQPKTSWSWESEPARRGGLAEIHARTTFDLDRSIEWLLGYSSVLMMVSPTSSKSWLRRSMMSLSFFTWKSDYAWQLNICISSFGSTYSRFLDQRIQKFPHLIVVFFWRGGGENKSPFIIINILSIYTKRHDVQTVGGGGTVIRPPKSWNLTENIILSTFCGPFPYWPVN